MKQIIHKLIAIGILAAGTFSAQSATDFSAYVGAYQGTSLLNSQSSPGTGFTFQIGVFNYGNVAANTDWFSWNSAGANTGFTQLSTGLLSVNSSNGALSVDSNDQLLALDFTYSAGPGGQIYTQSSIDSDGNPSFGSPLSPYLILTKERTGGNYLTDTRQVFVGYFNSALLGFDPEAIGNENYLGLTSSTDDFVALVGSVTGSSGTTSLNSAAVPEPSSLSLFVFGAAALAALRARKR
jgi:hypothetical protein